MAQKSNRGAQLFCWLFIVIDLAAVGVGGWLLIKSLRTEHWPVTDGVIQSAQMQSHSSDHGHTYSAEVTYTYRVGGASYTGDKVSVGQMSSSTEYARGILNRYSVGKKFSVHYSPTDPAEAVLETGIHGGTWICFGVGTAFVLAGVMFLQILGAAAKAQLPGALESSSVRTNPDGSISMNKPPVLMGVIFLMAGVAICFAQPSGGTPHWIIYAAGGVFGLAGIYLLLWRMGKQDYGKLLVWPILILFLAVFHWIAFGAGERIGTSTSPFSHHTGVNVKTPFAIFAIVLDVVIVAGLIHGFFKRRKD